MEIIILVIVLLLLVVGLVGSVVPVLPGPPISYVGLLLLHFFTDYTVNEEHLIILAVIVVAVTFLDYWLQIEGVKRFGGGKKATNGTIIGLIIGIFVFPPIGIIVGPFVGAYIGAKMEDNKGEEIKIAFGAILGFFGGTLLKLIFGLYIVYEAITLVF